MDRVFKAIKFKKSLLITFAVAFCLMGKNVFASDNVLQAIQVDGVNDSFNIIFKSDDIAEVKKTIQAPNKMILTLDGIRASKTINTIYNNTSNVDSVVVEPINDDSVKISIQGENASNAEVKFDTLKTPLGVLDKSVNKQKSSGEVVLSEPVNSYRPVYNQDQNDEEEGLSLGGVSSSAARHLKKMFKGDRLNTLMAFGLFAMIIMSGLKSIIKGKDNEIKVGLTQSLKENAPDSYRSGLNTNPMNNLGELTPVTAQSNINAHMTSASANNYGLRAYQNGTRSPYVTSEIQRPRPSISQPMPASANLSQSSSNMSSQINPATMKSAMQTMQKTAAPAMTKPKQKTANIDSMKFLESMTKIYEKNGRTDLAQGLKANMKKAKINLA